MIPTSFKKRQGVNKNENREYMYLYYRTSKIRRGIHNKIGEASIVQGVDMIQLKHAFKRTYRLKFDI